MNSEHITMLTLAILVIILYGRVITLRMQVRDLVEKLTGECDHEWMVAGPHDHHYTCTRCGKVE